MTCVKLVGSSSRVDVSVLAIVVLGSFDRAENTSLKKSVLSIVLKKHSVFSCLLKECVLSIVLKKHSVFSYLLKNVLSIVLKKHSVVFIFVFNFHVLHACRLGRIFFVFCF